MLRYSCNFFFVLQFLRLRIHDGVGCFYKTADTQGPNSTLMHLNNWHNESLSPPIPSLSSAISASEDKWLKSSNKDLLRSILKTRTKWKTSDNGEAIWSLELEAALLEGLAQYQPTVCRETVLLGRFPRRNQFISEYIWRKTGQRRTSKQIGSRLQQLRESSVGQELAHLLFPSPNPSLGSASSNPDGHPRTRTPHVTIFIDILPRGVPEQFDEVPPQPWVESQNIIHVSHHPRQLAGIDPTVTFVSRSPILAQSEFTVWTDHLVHTETSGPLTSLIDSGPPDPTGFLHKGSLVPGYWKTIVDSPDPTRYTILQHISTVDDHIIIFSATYCFRYPAQYATALPTNFAARQRASDLGPFQIQQV
ncbi:hypothetical protein FB451DRAFT_1249422 [Mycena latifolia]|nr:hypothetical protein FB451DRAFT_1249422 [Mycena latifolia]